MADGTIWDMLLEIYDEIGAREFLRTPQPFMNGKIPDVELAKGNDEEIRRWLHGCLYQIAT